MGVFLAYRVNWLRQIYGFFYNIKNDFQKNPVRIFHRSAPEEPQGIRAGPKKFRAKERAQISLSPVLTN